MVLSAFIHPINDCDCIQLHANRFATSGCFGRCRLDYDHRDLSGDFASSTYMKNTTDLDQFIFINYDSRSMLSMVLVGCHKVGNHLMITGGFDLFYWRRALLVPLK